MVKAVKANWITPDGALSFVCEYEIDQCEQIQVAIRIYRTALPTQFDTVVVFLGAPAEFSIRFPGGYFAFGAIGLECQVSEDGCTIVNVWVKVDYGANENAPSEHASGVLARFTTELLFPDEFAPIILDPSLDPDQPILPAQPEQTLYPVPAGEDQGEAATGDSALFPYIYVRKWPLVSPEQMQLRFITYTPLQSSPPQESLYGSLASASSRREMEELALDFIEGAAPYQGQFVTEADLHMGNFLLLAKLAAFIKRIEYVPAEVQNWVAAHVTPGLTATGSYASDLERIWESYFALVIAPWSEPVLLPQMSILLVAAHVLAQLMPTAAETPMLDHHSLRELAHASIILPKALFPLPPADSSPPSSPPSGQSGWIEAYAIGDLQMVRQRLLRYVPGEIAAIENLMRGERKEISRRSARQQIDMGMADSQESDILNNSAADTRNDLLAETIKTIAEKTSSKNYTNLSTSYGPPTLATVNGGPVTTTVQQGPNSDDVTRFAREVLNQTVNRISRSVGSVRGSSLTQELAETVTSIIDNSSGQTNQVNVLRWVNKVYEARVVNYGQRLMLEFMLVSPAASYQREVASGERVAVGPPLPLASQNIHSFGDITPTNYAHLAAQYGVTEIVPPPLDIRYVSVFLVSGESTLAAMPVGYRAKFAIASAIVAPEALPPTVMVGNKILQSPYAAVAMPSGCGSALAVAVGGCSTSGSPPAASVAVQASNTAQVSVTISCVPTESTMTEWRIKTYNALLAAYQAQRAHRSVIAEHALAGERAPFALRRIEARELRRACLSLVQERCAALTGYPDLTAGSAWGRGLAGPRRQQFIEEMFEWNEMSFRYFRQAGSGAPVLAIDQDGDDAGPLTAFLEADLARVLVPARPELAMDLLYLLSSGTLWEGGKELTPVDSADVPIVNELKTMAVAPHGCHCVGHAWEILVPTAMQIIDGVDLENLR
jgi:hypothetical protein